MTQNLDLLELGTNNFELIEFSLRRTLPSGEVRTGIYGVNVAKVREVVRMPKINTLASSVAGVEGIFELRGVPIPAINLCRVLGDRNATINQEQQIIVAEFSMKRAGFIVSQTHCIRRVEWSKVMAPSAGESSFMTGMILRDDNEFLFILDLEKIIAKLENSANRSDDDRESAIFANAPVAPTPTVMSRPEPGKDAPGILLVDDSSVIRTNVQIFLQKHGYRVKTKENGKDALTFLEEYANELEPDGRIDVVVTDVEMPKMDGLTLTKKIREHPVIGSIPILLHSSLSNPATKQAGLKAGANGYVIKNDPNVLLKHLSGILVRAA